MELTDQGKKELKTVAEMIKKQATIVRIYASPMKRAIDSAHVLNQSFEVPAEVITEEDFNEVDIPALLNKSITLRDELFRKKTDEYIKEFVEEGNESREEVSNRMFRGFKKVVDENNEKSIAIISHGDPIRFLLFAITNPSEKIPSMHILSKSDYLERGEAWKIVINDKNEFVEKQLLTYKKT